MQISAVCGAAKPSDRPIEIVSRAAPRQRDLLQGFVNRPTPGEDCREIPGWILTGHRPGTGNCTAADSATGVAVWTPLQMHPFNGAGCCHHCPSNVSCI